MRPLPLWGSSRSRHDSLVGPQTVELQWSGSLMPPAVGESSGALIPVPLLVLLLVLQPLSGQRPQWRGKRRASARACVQLLMWLPLRLVLLLLVRLDLCRRLRLCCTPPVSLV